MESFQYLKPSWTLSGISPLSHNNSKETPIKK